MNKTKVVLICHFTTQWLREKLKLQTGVRVNYADFGLWNINIINGLKKRKDIELHVVLPHKMMRKSSQEFYDDGVYYYVFRSELPFPWTSIDWRWQRVRNFPRNRRYVNKVVRRIKPDIVNLVGAENPYYSATALDINNVPIILHCQTVYANPARKELAGGISKQRWNIELELFHKIKYIACSGQLYYDLIKGYSPEAIIFPRVWPRAPFPKIKDVPKKYDFVCFSKILNKKKGFDNAIEAIGLVSNKYPELKVLAVGCWDNERPYLETRIKELGIADNIEIHPPIPDYIDLLQYIKQARFALLPIKMDVISGTIIEAMRLGLPIVTNRTSGTPSLNDKRETVLISEIGDNETLADNMMKLMENESYAEMLRTNAYQYIREMDEANALNEEIMVAQYKAVINHFNNRTPIPQDLLFYKTDNNN